MLNDRVLCFQRFNNNEVLMAWKLNGRGILEYDRGEK